MNVGAGGYWGAALTYVNHSSAEKFADEVFWSAVAEGERAGNDLLQINSQRSLLR